MLDLVINNNEGIGSYRYNTLDDAKHVTALCVSIKGDILRGLGLWKEAAETLIKSIDLTNALQRIEKKIISGSMAHLADTFRYMSIGDYKDVAQQLKLVTGHPLREAIRYATEAAQRCIFTPLFYLKNKVGLYNDTFLQLISNLLLLFIIHIGSHLINFTMTVECQPRIII